MLHPYLVVAALVASIACDPTASLNEPEATGIAVVLDRGAILPFGRYVTIAIPRPAPVEDVYLEIVLPAGRASRVRYEFACTPGEKLAVYVTVEHDDACSSSRWTTQRIITCEAGRTVDVAFGRPENDPANQHCNLSDTFPPDMYPCSGEFISDDETRDPATGRRVRTATVYVQCSYDNDDHPSAELYASDLQLTCGDTTLALPVAGAPAYALPAFPPLVRFGSRYARDLGGGDTTEAYFGITLVLDFRRIGRAPCTVSFVATIATVSPEGERIPIEGMHGIQIETAIADDGAILRESQTFGPAHSAIGPDALAHIPLTRVVPTTSLTP